MQEGRKVQGMRETVGMGECLGQGQRLLAPPQGLRRIAQTPQRERRIGQAPHPWGLTKPERQGLLRRRIGEGDPLREVPPGIGVFAQEEQGAPESIMGLQAGRGFSPALCQSGELFRQLARRL